MDSLPPPLAFVVLFVAGWVNRQQQAVIDYKYSPFVEVAFRIAEAFGVPLETVFRYDKRTRSTT